MSIKPLAISSYSHAFFLLSRIPRRQHLLPQPAAATASFSILVPNAAVQPHPDRGAVLGPRRTGRAPPRRHRHQPTTTLAPTSSTRRRAFQGPAHRPPHPEPPIQTLLAPIPSHGGRDQASPPRRRRPPPPFHLPLPPPPPHPRPADLCLAPKAIAAADDFVLIRVPVNPLGKDFFQHNDYFVYRAHHQDPKLDLLPNPWPNRFGDDEIAILSCGSASADGDKQYVVAALKIRPFDEYTFTLHLYRSKPGSETGSWTSQLVSVEDPLRDRVCPIPDTAERLMYHLTTEVIMLGGAKGTVAWVDLWRGILLCDVLETSPKLRDVPLPLPAKGNWRSYLSDCERFCRDITVSQHKGSIKYVEMEIIPPRMVTSISSSTPDPVSYLEWVRWNYSSPQPTCSLVPGQWKVTTWSMPIPVTSSDNWHRECTAELRDFHVESPTHHKLLHKFIGSSGDKEAKEAMFSLGCLHMAYPTFSVDNDVIYLLCKAASMSKMGLVIAFDVREKKLRGAAKLDSKTNTSFMRCYLACGISKHLRYKSWTS